MSLDCATVKREAPMTTPDMASAAAVRAARVRVRMSHSTAPESVAEARRWRRLLALVLGRPPFRFRAAALQEILRPVERAVLRVELRKRISLDRIDEQMCGL